MLRKDVKFSTLKYFSEIYKGSVETYVRVVKKTQPAQVIKGQVLSSLIWNLLPPLYTEQSWSLIYSVISKNLSLNTPTYRYKKFKPIFFHVTRPGRLNQKRGIWDHKALRMAPHIRLQSSNCHHKVNHEGNNWQIQALLKPSDTFKYDRTKVYCI